MQVGFLDFVARIAAVYCWLLGLIERAFQAGDGLRNATELVLDFSAQAQRGARLALAVAVRERVLPKAAGALEVASAQRQLAVVERVARGAQRALAGVLLH